MNTHESPQRYARVGGALYLFIIVAALFGETFVRGSLIVWGDAAATAGKLIGSETLFRSGLVAEMFTCACDVTLAMILYVLLRPVNKNLALLGAFFRLTFVAIYGVSKLFEIMALVMLGSSKALVALDPQELQALAYAMLKMHSYVYGVSLLFFGFCCICFGYLIRVSGYLPGILGTALAIAGVSYVAFSMAQMQAPAFAAAWLFPWLMLPGFFSELGLALWLLMKGVDLTRWQKGLEGHIA